MSTGPCDCVVLREQVRVMRKALKQVQKWLLDNRAVADDGINHPLFVKANNAVVQALNQESLGDGGNGE